MPSRGRNFGLDIARAAAISSVLLSHFLLEPATGKDALWTALVYIGAGGVELFFSLSGFLIGGLLLDLACAGLRPRTVAEFWFRRWMRTLPLYFALLVVLGWWFGARDPHAFLFLQNFYPAEPRLIPAAWSLVLEEYFYLFFPATMLLLSAAVSNGIRVVAYVAIALIVACTAGRAANAAGLFHLGWDYVHTHPFLRMDCAAYGVLAACLYRAYRPAVERVVTRWQVPLVTCSLAAATLWGALFVAVLVWPGAVAQTGYRWWGPPWFVIQSSFLDLVFAVLVLTLFVTRPSPRGWRPLAWAVRQCSVLSYSMYLVHMPVMSLVEAYAAPRSGLIKLVLLVAGTTGASMLTYFAIERPFLSLRDAVSRRRAPALGRAAHS